MRDILSLSFLENSSGWPVYIIFIYLQNIFVNYNAFILKFPQHPKFTKIFK